MGGIILTRVFELDDGSMSKDKRDASLEKITNSKSTKVILISFKAGSTGELMVVSCVFYFSLLMGVCTGLNLTACNNVILVDLWWNPALEVRPRLPAYLDSPR